MSQNKSASESQDTACGVHATSQFNCISNNDENEKTRQVNTTNHAVSTTQNEDTR